MDDSAANGQSAHSLGRRRADTLPRSGLLLDARFASGELASDATGVLPVAVVGAGAQATAHLIPALLQLPRVALVAVCDADGARAAAVATRFRSWLCSNRSPNCWMLWRSQSGPPARRGPRRIRIIALAIACRISVGRFRRPEGGGWL